MVALLPIVTASLAVLFMSPALANPTAGSIVEGLVIRQTNGTQTNGTSPLDKSKLPLNLTQCASDCDTVAKIDRCSGTEASCVCKNDLINSLGGCLNCAVSIPEAKLDKKTAQDFINGVTTACQSVGSPVNSFTITAKNGAIRASLTLGSVGVIALGAVLAMV